MKDIVVVETVLCSQEEAFNAFVTDFQKWWPQAYSLSRECLACIGIEPKVGGMCYEIGPYGFRCDWGRVLTWQPPAILVFTWQITAHRVPEPNPALVSEVSVSFAEVETGQTQVKLEHKHLCRHGEGSDAYREELASEYGWPYILGEFKKYIQ